jgi:hypothetical protein
MIFIATSALLVWLAIRAGQIHSALLDHCQLNRARQSDSSCATGPRRLQCSDLGLPAMPPTTGWT